MTARLFTPDGPAITPAERRQALAAARDAQMQLALADECALEDGRAWLQASEPFGVWFDDNAATTPTLAQWKAARR
jgi:hypothetical protein